MDALGFDRIIVETVGVGQSELAVRDVADLVVLVSAPGAGDALQAMKSGVVEVGDVHVVNKADREGASRVARDLRGAVGLSAEGVRPDILLAQADSGEGISALVDAFEAFLASAVTTGRHRRRRLRRLERETAALVERRAVEHVRVMFDAQLRAEVSRGLADGRSPHDLGRQVWCSMSTGLATESHRS
jgi:LAO/AO transport system kinase